MLGCQSALPLHYRDENRGQISDGSGGLQKSGIRRSGEFDVFESGERDALYGTGLVDNSRALRCFDTGGVVVYIRSVMPGTSGQWPLLLSPPCEVGVLAIG